MYKSIFVNLFALFIISVCFVAGPAQAQQAESYPVGNPLGLTSDGNFQPISSNVTVFGAIYNAESCIYDAQRDLIIVPSRGVPQNDAWASLINHDGSVHTSKWIGVQNSRQRSNLSPPLVLNDPLAMAEPAAMIRPSL